MSISPLRFPATALSLLVFPLAGSAIPQEETAGTPPQDAIQELLTQCEASGFTEYTSYANQMEYLEAVQSTTTEMNAAGLTLVVVTHDPAVARRARRVLVLQDGRVLQRVDGAHVHEAVEALSREENEP